jgi:aspartyl-tRNA(Asn)/glutamyl-tRNA(Gln) amidotransferase subunit A
MFMMSNMNIFGKSIKQLIELLKKREISKEELFNYFLARSKKYNSELNTYLTILEEMKPAGDDSNMAGIPMSIKDNFCMNGVRTTAASKVLDNFISPYSATVVDRLNKAGVSFVGKTNMDAWAHGSSTETSDYGPVKNPWDLTRSPGGSSGGSAASVTAYLVPAAIGSETAGSIRQPASWSGIVGLKPTYGRVSRYGVVAMGSSLDCPGPMTLTVEDAAIILKTIAGNDSYDATTSMEKVEDYPNLIANPKKLKIGVADEYFEGIDDDVKNKVIEAIEIFKKQGHQIKKIKLIPPKYAISVYTIIQRSEVSSNLARYDGIRYGHDRKHFGDEAKKRIMLGAYTLSYGYYDAYYKKAQKVRTLIVDDFMRVFRDVDVVVAPTTPITALKLGEFEKYPFFGETMDVLNEPAAVAGLPAISIPVGLDGKKLPVGLQIMARYFDESTILNLAHQFEKETDFFGVIKFGMEKYKD